MSGNVPVADLMFWVLLALMAGGAVALLLTTRSWLAFDEGEGEQERGRGGRGRGSGGLEADGEEPLGPARLRPLRLPLPRVARASSAGDRPRPHSSYGPSRIGVVTLLHMSTPAVGEGFTPSRREGVNPSPTFRDRL